MRIPTQVDRTPQAEGNRELLMATRTQERDSLGSNTLSVALIGPDDLRRSAVADALAGSQAHVAKMFASYPGIDDVPRLLESGYDVVIMELDSDPERALDLVENVCADSSVTVMVYSAQADPSMLVRCMRAGAREFLPLPISARAMEEALVRAMVRRPAAHPIQKALGKLLVFIGAKGGCGVTTIAANFAMVVAQESNQNTLLIDFGLPIGDAALGLGVRAQFSVANALENLNRLDSNFFSKLLAKHSSGLSVLAAPNGYTPVKTTIEGVERLVTVARRTFDYVIVDAGSQMGPTSKALFKEAAAVYLVTEVSISGLRNSNRLISEFFTASGFKPEIVLNRFTQRTLGIDEKDIGKALTVAPQWKIPSDWRAASRAWSTASPLVLEDSPISRVIRQMARTACGLQNNPEKKKSFSLFG
jgi:pilus assembly protein CpaE